jgi:hypothetical protein
MDKIVLKYKQFIFGVTTTLLFFSFYYMGLVNIISIIFIPILIGIFFLIYSENRQRDIYFRDEISKINKYLDIDYYLNNDCYNGCDVYYEIKDFIEKFKCNNDISIENKKIFNRILIFYNTYGESIKSEDKKGEDKLIISVDSVDEFKRTLSEIKILL